MYKDASTEASLCLRKWSVKNNGVGYKLSDFLM